MPAFISIGRFLFCVYFVFSGATKLLDLAATTQIAQRVTVPAMLASYTAQLEAYAGMPFPQLLALSAGIVQVVCGILIALNFGARFFALILIVYLGAVIFYYHDFWNQSGAGASRELVLALIDLALIGGLMVIAGIGRGPRVVETAYNDV
jgi:putative oxidoreductase